MTINKIVEMAAAHYAVARVNSMNGTPVAHDFRQLATAMLEVGGAKVERIVHMYLHGLLDAEGGRARWTAGKVFVALWLIEEPLDVQLPEVAIKLIWGHGHDLDRRLVAKD
jgi:hypothetical protein